MAADQGLISASLKEAQSRVGPDKTGYYKAMANTPVNLMTSVAEIFKQKEIKNNEAWENAAGNTEEMLNSLASEDQLGNMGQANIAHLKSLKKEFLAAGGNKDKENEVKIKIQKVVKTINKLAAGFGKYGEAYLSDTLDKKASDAEFTNILGRIWEKDGEYGDVEFNWKENGDLDFVVDGFATSSSALFEKLVLKNAETTNGLGKIGVSNEKRGGSGLEYDRGGNIQQVKSLWSGPEGKKKFATTINSSTFGYESFIEALVNNSEIHKTLTDLGSFNYDNSEDNKVTASDFATDENKQQLIDALTNVHSNTFDFEAAKEVAGSWYSDGYLKSKYNDGAKTIKTADTKPKIGTVFNPSVNNVPDFTINRLLTLFKYSFRKDGTAELGDLNIYKQDMGDGKIQLKRANKQGQANKDEVLGFEFDPTNVDEVNKMMPFIQRILFGQATAKELYAIENFKLYLKTHPEILKK